MAKLQKVLFICLLSTQAFAQATPETAVWIGNSGNNDHTHYVNTPSDASHFKILWSKQFTGPTPNDSGSIETSITNKALYVMSTTRYPVYSGLFAINLETGETIWNQPFPNSIWTASAPAFANGNLFYLLSDADGKKNGCFVASYQAATGKPVFSTAAPCRDIDTFESPMVDGNHIYTEVSPLINGQLVGLMHDMDATSGKLLNTFNIHGYAAPMVTDEYLISDASRSDGLRVFNRSNGQLLFTMPNSFNTDTSVYYTQPVYDAKSKTVFIILFDLTNHKINLYAFDLATRTIKWTRATTSQVHSPAFADNTLYMVENRTLHAINATDGSDSWQWKIDDKHTDMPEYQSTYVPVVTQNHIIISGRGYTYAINRMTHEKEWELNKSGDLQLGETAFYIQDYERIASIIAVAIN